MLGSTPRHWPEYLMEGTGLGLFMLSACVFTTILEHPASPIHRQIPEPLVRRALMGLAMGLTAIGNVYSPWGRRSGAHLNPAFTIAFWRLGKMESRDALSYVASQFVGGVAGVLIAKVLVGEAVAHPAVAYVTTVPGPAGPVAALAAEMVISFLQMSLVLLISNTAGWSRFTGMFAGLMVAIYITLEAPISGMSMNPARTFGSALPSGIWTALWIYFTAPPLGMLLASEAYLRLKGARRVFCAKLHPHNTARCIFRCNFGALAAEEGA